MSENISKITFTGVIAGKYIKPVFVDKNATEEDEKKEKKPSPRFQFIEIFTKDDGTHKISISEISVKEDTFKSHEVGDSVTLDVKQWEMNGKTGLFEV